MCGCVVSELMCDAPVLSVRAVGAGETKEIITELGGSFPLVSGLHFSS